MNSIRKAFESVTAQNFVGLSCQYDYERGTKSFERNEKGEYIEAIIEDHWQTFQEGWELALEHLKNKTNPCYSDIISDGKMDPRND